MKKLLVTRPTTEENLTYDANGNIMTMNQKGFKINGSGLIDQLTYTYQTNSNKLSKVDDAVNVADSKMRRSRMKANEMK
jgi:hypothetical protein